MSGAFKLLYDIIEITDSLMWNMHESFVSHSINIRYIREL